MSVVPDAPASGGRPSAVAAPGEAPPAWAHRWSVLLLVAGLLSSVLSGQSERVGLPISPDRVLIPAGVGLALLAARHRDGGRLCWRAVHTLMVATVLWVAWSAATAGTLTTGSGAFALLDRIVVPFALFAVAPFVLRTAVDRAVLLKGLVLLGLYLGVTAFLEVIGPSSLVLPRYVMDPSVGILFGRARGPFVAAEADGMVLAACLFAAALGVVRLRGLWRAFCVAAVPLTGLGVVLTLTRSVWLGTILGVLAVVLLVPALRRRLPLIVAAGVAALAMLLFAVPSLSSTITERITTVRSLDDRSNTNTAALKAISEEPLTGIGWMRFLEDGTEWVRQSDEYPVTNVRIEIHNVVLSRAAETGIPGAALWVAVVIAGPVAAATRRRPLDGRWPQPGGFPDAGDARDLAGWHLVLIGTGAVWAVCVMLSPVPYPLPNNLFFLLGGMMARPWLFPADRPAPDGGHGRARAAVTS